jgi:hypothetical protein
MNDLPKICRALVRRWTVLYSILMVLHFVLGTVSVAFPLLAAMSLLGTDGDSTRLAFGLIASVAAAIVAFLRPDRYGLGFFQAYSSLHVALLTYEHSNKDRDAVRHLLNAIRASYRRINLVQPASAAQVREAVGDGKA